MKKLFRLASALVAGLFVMTITAPVSAEVIINEFMASPISIEAADGQWIELANTSDSPVSVDGWKIDGALIDADAPIAANGMAVICRNADSLTNGGVDCDGTASFDLDADGQTLTLIDDAEVVVDSFDYAGEDVDDGASTEVIQTATDPALNAADDAGTPGAANSLPDNTVRNQRTGVVYDSIQAAMDAATAGDTIVVAAGTYDEQLTIDEALTIEGAGDDASTGTVLAPAAAGSVVTITGSNVTLRGLRIDRQGIGSGVSLAGPTMTDIAFDGVTVTGAVGTLVSLGTGLRVGSAANVDGLTVTDSHFDGNDVGWYLAHETASGTDVTNVDVSNTSFSNNSVKGIYAEKLSNAVFDNITVANSGTNAGYGFNAGIDINLKWAAYDNITISNSTVSGSGLLGSASNRLFPVAITIKARDDAPSYASPAASLDEVNLTNLTITGGVNSLRFGETGKSNNGPTNVNISGSSFTGAEDYAIVNSSLATVTANNNWWGASNPDFSEIMFGSVTHEEWCEDAACESSRSANVFIDADTDGVYDDGEEAFDTIQAAVADAEAGDTIQVLSGSYSGQVNVDKALTILGANAGESALSDSRSDETVLSAADAVGFNVLVLDVTIDGFTIEAASGVSTESGTSADGLEVLNNIITGSSRSKMLLHTAGEADGTTISGNDLVSTSRSLHLSGVGFTDLVISDNRFSGAAATGIQFFNDTPIDGFDFTGNQVQHTSNLGASITNGNISDNEFSFNSTTVGLQIQLQEGSVLSDNSFDGNLTAPCLQIFGSQFGLTPSSNATISDNTFTDCGATAAPGNYAIQLSQDISDITISGNTITNAQQGINTRIGDGWDFTGQNIVIDENSITGSRDKAISNTVNGTLVASHNWFGTAVESTITGLMNGTVTFSPWYVNSGLTILSSTAAIDDDEVTVDDGDELELPADTPGTAQLPTDTEILTFNSGATLNLNQNTQTATVTVVGSTPTVSIGGSQVNQTQTIGNQPVVLEKQVTLQSGTGNAVTIKSSDSAVANVTVEVPNNTTIYASNDWDGTIQPPTVTTIDSTETAPSGFTFGDTVLKVGSDEVTLVFDEVVTLLLEGVSSQVGYKAAGSTEWQLIADCGGTFASPVLPTFPGECSITDGTDTKILTFHFTEFAALTVASDETTDDEDDTETGSSTSTPVSNAAASTPQVASEQAGTSSTATDEDVVTEDTLAKAAVGDTPLAWWYWALLGVTVLAVVYYLAEDRIREKLAK